MSSGWNPSTDGPTLRAAREAAGMSRRELAETLGTTPSSVWGWEAGRHRPLRVFRARLAELGLTHDHQRKE